MTGAADGAARDGRVPAWEWAVVAVIALGAGLRLAGIFDDFWFDEIWSWRIARGVHAAWDVLMSPEARSDNNHPLNTLLMYWLGDRAYWSVYRVPSLLAGVGTCVLATWHVARRVGRTGAVVAALLVGLSYPMIVYSSEARGYGLMVFFALVCFVAMDRYLRERSWAAAGVFSASAVLGFLSHLTFAHFYLAAAAWSGFRLARESRSWRAAVVDFLRCQLVPAGFAVWLYVVFAGQLTVGGAPDTSLWGVVADAASLMAGGPAGGVAAVVIAVVAGLVVFASLAAVWRDDRALAVFFLTCVLLSPAAFVVMQAVSMRGTETLFPRYFLASMAFGYLLVATAMSVVWRRGGRGPRAAVAALLAMYAAGSLYQTALFLRGTRGHYAEAVRYMADHTPGSFVTVTGDQEDASGRHDARTVYLLTFYSRTALAEGKSIVYMPPPPAGNPEWLIVNTPQAGIEPVRRLLVGGVPYAFDREFTYHGLSGWSWYLFRRQPAPATGR